MHDMFSFVSANLRLMKIHWKNNGAPLAGMGDGGKGASLAGRFCVIFRCIYKDRNLRSAATDKAFRQSRGSREELGL